MKPTKFILLCVFLISISCASDEGSESSVSSQDGVVAIDPELKCQGDGLYIDDVVLDNAYQEWQVVSRLLAVYKETEAGREFFGRVIARSGSEPDGRDRPSTFQEGSPSEALQYKVYLETELFRVEKTDKNIKYIKSVVISKPAVATGHSDFALASNSNNVLEPSNFTPGVQNINKNNSAINGTKHNDSDQEDPQSADAQQKQLFVPDQPEYKLVCNEPKA